jgi:hypothetical protein
MWRRQKEEDEESEKIDRRRKEEEKYKNNKNIFIDFVSISALHRKVFLLKESTSS